MTENPNPGPKTKELISVLNALIHLLDSSNETHWSQYLMKVKTRLNNSDLSGVEYLLRAYGGMGSFNDLMLADHHSDFELLRDKAWELATYIKRNAVIEE